MRLAFYLAHYPLQGGSTAAVHGLAHGLERAGQDVAILCQGEADLSFVEEGVRVLSFRRPRGRLPFRVSSRLLDYIRANLDRLDLIILVGMFHTDLPPLAYTAQRSRLPYALAPLDPYHPTIFRKHALRKAAYWRLVERQLLQNAIAVQNFSASQARHIRKLGVTSPTITVPGGCDTASTCSPAADWRRADTVTFGYLGRLDLWHKGLDLLLDGFANTRDKFPDTRLILQGADWGDRDRLRLLAERFGLDGAVIFKAASYASSSPELISNWDALVLPSRYDGFALTVVEAMLAGRPVICSAEAGVAEHVERSGCGIVIEPSVDGIAGGILRLFESRMDWPRMGRAGREYARTYLNWDRIARGAIECYEQVLSERKTKHFQAHELNDRRRA